MVWHGLSPDAEQELVAARSVVALLVVVVVVVVVVSGGASASTAALLVPVFALALQVFVVRINRSACALVVVKVLIWLFASGFSSFSRTQTCFLEAFAFPGRGNGASGAIAGRAVVLLVCWSCWLL